MLARGEDASEILPVARELILLSPTRLNDLDDDANTVLAGMIDLISTYILVPGINILVIIFLRCVMGHLICEVEVCQR